MKAHKNTAQAKNLSERNIGFFKKDGTVETIYVGNLVYSKNENDIRDLERRDII